MKSLLRRRLDPALDEPQDFVVQRAPLLYSEVGEALVERGRKPQSQLDDLSSVFLACFAHGQSVDIGMISCQYRNGIDGSKGACYTKTVSLRAHKRPHERIRPT